MVILPWIKPPLCYPPTITRTIGDKFVGLGYRANTERKEKGRGEERKHRYFSYFSYFLFLFLNSALAAFEAFADR